MTTTPHIISGKFGTHDIQFETGRLAKQAHGAVLAQLGETVVLAAVVSDAEPKKGIDFFPLTVDYRERTYAAGKIPGGFFKREGRPTEKEILTSRLIDRPIRPLFSESYRNETQVIVTVLSVDEKNVTDILAMNAASAALMVSDVPFHCPIGAVRVGLVDGEFVANPDLSQIANSVLDLVLAATETKALMIEAGANEITEEKMAEVIAFGHAEIKKVIALQKELVKKAGKPKRAVPPAEFSEDIVQKIESVTRGQFDRIFTYPMKEEREKATKELYNKALEQFDAKAADFCEIPIKSAFDLVEKKNVRSYILDQKKRPDGRGFEDIRPITCEVGVLPRTHGSSVFTRGQTQSLGVTTLGTGQDEQRIDSLEGDMSKSFMLHYNFPSFSVGEAKPNRGPGRREIGHGALAERALKPVLPSQEKFPYTIRLVSEILESNGSSSMASVCAGTLALMDAGVPLSDPVAGIALGLITRKDKWQVITDIAGIEDHHGDMDFKAAGTRKGLTALQMDLKIDGVTVEMLQESFRQAKKARFAILDKIAGALAAPRENLSEFAPRIVRLRINPEKIGELIGPGGKNIRRITEETGAKIDIEDDGTVFVASVDENASNAALERIRAITEEPELGKIYRSRVRKLMKFGAFCEVLPGVDGLLHVSELADGFVKDVTEYLRVDDEVMVKVVNVENGKTSLSAKQVEGNVLTPKYPSDESLVAESPKRGDRGERPRARSRR